MRTLIAAVFLVFGIHSLFAQNRNYVETNGVKIYYETYGEDEPLLMLHGFTVSGKSWEPLRDELSKKYKLIVPDM